MKKLINIILVIAIVMSNFIPAQLDVKADTCSYHVTVLKSDGTSNQLNCYTSYNDAKNAMLNHNSDQDNVAVIYNSSGKLINAKYAIAKFTPGNVINVYPSATSSSKFTYISTSYAIDAAFLDYDPNKNRAKIRISGYTGWVDFKYVNIVPIVDIAAKTVTVLLDDNIRIRTGPGLSYSHTGKYVTKGSVHRYYNKKNADGYTFYEINYDGDKFGWFASKEGSWTIESTNTLRTYYIINNTYNTLRHYFEYYSHGQYKQLYNTIDRKPNFLSNGLVYYSFDGNYFYTNLIDMLDDYRNNENKRAINAGNPYYAYYLYLPPRVKTGYRAEDFDTIIERKGYNRKPDPNVQYVIYDSSVNNYRFDSSINRTGISLMYGEGQSFVDMANKYGVNALMMFSTAINESATGTSLLAFLKNNIFGTGASDSNPIVNAYSFDTVRDSIEYYAMSTGSSNSSYSNPNGSYYHGSHYGNKGSGMNIMYASDPYWGEKQAANSFNFDYENGLQDLYSNTIGVTTKKDVKIYKRPSTSSSVIYTLKNNRNNVSVDNIPLIVADKVYVTEGGVTSGWYKVYTEVALDENQNIADVPYEFSKSYGYIKESDLYVANQQPTITFRDENKISYQGQDIDLEFLLDGVTASDPEDGDLTDRITVSGEYDIYLPNTYDITYTVTDNSNFSYSKTITLTVLQNEEPVIIAKDKQIPQYVEFDPYEGVTANDYLDGDITASIEVIENEVIVAELGTYEVTYRVVNSREKVTEKTITVEVIPNEPPVIKAQNYAIKVDDSFDPLKGVTATDKEDGDITASIEVIENEVDTSKVGTYKVTYWVIDNADNETTKTVYITVEERNYINKKGEFYFEKMEWNSITNKLEVAGYLAITGVNNTKNDNIKYDLILKCNTDNTERIFPLERWLEGHPNRNYSDGIYNYSATWFKGSVDLSDVLAGEYTLYVRARLGNYQAINYFRNVFGKPMVRKVQISNDRGYLFRNNSYKVDFPIELFIRDNGLISTIEPSHSSNMFTSYRTMEIKNNSLNIIGTSYNVNGDYSKSANVERYLILENMATFERYTYNIGSIVGEEIPLRVSDGKSKVRGWFDTTNKVDISNLPVGKYIIYIRTKTGNVDDYGELNDIFLKSTDNIKATINNKVYTVHLNKNLRFRIELHVTAK